MLTSLSMSFLGPKSTPAPGTIAWHSGTLSSPQNHRLAVTASESETDAISQPTNPVQDGSLMLISGVSTGLQCYLFELSGRPGRKGLCPPTKKQRRRQGYWQLQESTIQHAQGLQGCVCVLHAPHEVCHWTAGYPASHAHDQFFLNSNMRELSTHTCEDCAASVC